MTNKKLGLLLLPLVPLSAIGIVEVANAIVAPEPVAVIHEQPEKDCELRPVVTSKPTPPPVVATPSRPQPAPPK